MQEAYEKVFGRPAQLLHQQQLILAQGPAPGCIKGRKWCAYLRAAMKEEGGNRRAPQSHRVKLG